MCTMIWNWTPWFVQWFRIAEFFKIRLAMGSSRGGGGDGGGGGLGFSGPAAAQVEHNRGI